LKQSTKLRRMAQILWAYRGGRTRLPYYPLRLWIEPTNACNLKCPLCPQSEDDWQPRGYLEYGLFCKIIDEVKDQVHDINLTHRGESLFNKRIYDMIAYARERGVRVRLHTNATPLTPKNIDLLLTSGLDFLSISFDGYDKEGYEEARLGATYEETLSKLMALLARKRQLGLKAPYTVMQVIEGKPLTPRQERVKHDLERMLRRASLDKFYVKAAHNWAGNISEAKVGRLEARAFSPCTFLWYSLTIQYGGSVNPCPQDWYGEMPLGELTTQSVWDVWNGEPLVKLRQSMLDGDLADYPVCQKCDRICRPTTMGIPHENLKSFASENLIGYRYLSRFVHR
jgi:MoaA/NifB/PqqE/SkfB family radical SAM enzyme